MLIYFYISVSPTLSWLLCVLLQPYDKLLVVLQISTTQHILIACRKTVLMDPTIVNDYQVRIIWIAIIGRRFMSLIQSNINLRFICVFFFMGSRVADDIDFRRTPQLRWTFCLHSKYSFSQLHFVSKATHLLVMTNSILTGWSAG